jgi:hypothetical protein
MEVNGDKGRYHAAWNVGSCRVFLRESNLALSWDMQALLRWFLSAVALLALGTLGACAASETAGAGAGDDGTNGTGGGGGTAGAQLTVEFTQAEPVLEPSETTELVVRVTPISPSRTVRFALIDFDGAEPYSDVADAALENTTEAVTDEDGLARVRLIAPSVPTTFDVRAMVEGVEDTHRVEVMASGRETLIVHYDYMGGRSVTDWVVEVYDDGRTCADLEGNPPVGADPALSRTVPKDDQIRLSGMPVGTKLAVTLRAGYFAGGCSGVDAVVEGQVNSVLVTVTNRPIQLDESEVELELGLVGQEEALSSGMESVIDAARDALLGQAANDSEALLDAMQEEAMAGAVCSTFGSARDSIAWDDELEVALGEQAMTSIRDDLGGWLAGGIPSLARDDALVATLAAEPDVMGAASLVWHTIAGFPASDAGFPESAGATWTADAHDNVSLGATIEFNPAALLVQSAADPAMNDVPEASSVAQALAIRGERCDTVTAALVARGQGPGQSCLGCDADCTRLLCERGLERLVVRASKALDAEPATLRVAATGSAEVGEQAELRTLDGSWVGALDAANRSSELTGELSAEGD